MERGEIWSTRVRHPARTASFEQGPVLIVQADAFNRSAIQTVVVVALTTDERLGLAPGNVLLTKKQSGLTQTSVVDVAHLQTVEKARLSKRISRLSTALMARVERGLRLVLQLESAS